MRSSKFYRQKTKRTKKKDLRPIKVGLNPRAKEIIEMYKNTNPENDYLFPILEPGLGAKLLKIVVSALLNGLIKGCAVYVKI